MKVYFVYKDGEVAHINYDKNKVTFITKFSEKEELLTTEVLIDDKNFIIEFVIKMNDDIVMGINKDSWVLSLWDCRNILYICFGVLMECQNENYITTQTYPSWVIRGIIIE